MEDSKSSQIYFYIRRRDLPLQVTAFSKSALFFVGEGRGWWGDRTNQHARQSERRGKKREAKLVGATTDVWDTWTVIVFSEPLPIIPLCAMNLGEDFSRN